MQSILDDLEAARADLDAAMGDLGRLATAASARPDKADRDARILALRAEGKTIRAVAEEVRCSDGTVVAVTKAAREAAEK